MLFVVFMLLLFVANADIYFDNTLALLLSDVYGNTIDFKNQVFALLKWVDRGDALSIHLRTDSQDSWIFQPPLHSRVIELSNFHLGIAKCDNRVVEIFESSGYHVLNPAFAVRGIELQSVSREGSLYGMKGAAHGDVRDVFLSDLHVF